MGSSVPAQNPLSWIFFTLGTVTRCALLLLVSFLAPLVRYASPVRKSASWIIGSSPKAWFRLTRRHSFTTFSQPSQNPLRFESVHKSWERNCFSYVVQAANPSNCSFYTQAKACVFAASVSSDIQVPVKYFFWQALFFNFCF